MTSNPNREKHERRGTININCLWCKKPMQVKPWTNYDGTECYRPCCSDKCQSAQNAYNDEQMRMKKEAKETPTYFYKKIMKASKKIQIALLGEEIRYTKRGGHPVTFSQFMNILKREFITDDGLKFSSNKILEWKQQQRERDWREQYFNQDPVTEEIRDGLLKWMKRKRYTHLFK